MTISTFSVGGILEDTTDPRVLKALVLPYGEVGSTNLGEVKFEAGTVALPTEPVNAYLKIQHDGEASKIPIGIGESFEETPRGVVGSFRIVDGLVGDRFLEDHHKGNKKNISAEVDQLVTDGINAVSGTLLGAAAVVIGAFPSARFFELGEEPPAPAGPQTTTEKFTDEFIDENNVKRKRTTTRVTTVEDGKTTIKETTVIEDPNPEPETETEPLVANATAPKTLGGGKTAATAGPAFFDFKTLFENVAAIARGEGNSTMLAAVTDALEGSNVMFGALNDVKYNGTGGVGSVMSVSQFVGELWAGVEYKQLVADLLSHGDLTALKVTGWHWTTKPTGGDWAGNKSNVPSNTPVVAPDEITADRFAGAHDHAREHVDFNTPGYFESYYKAMTESYKAWVDAKALAALNTAAGSGTVADNPAGLTIGAGMSALIDGAAQVITNGALPTFALVAPGLYKQILKTPDNATLAYLNAALGLEDGSLASFTLRPNANLATGNVIVGAKQAAQVLELPGVPIRVDALDMVKGGVDTGVFGYEATLIHKANAIVKIPPSGA